MASGDERTARAARARLRAVGAAACDSRCPSGLLVWDNHALSPPLHALPGHLTGRQRSRSSMRWSHCIWLPLLQAFHLPGNVNENMFHGRSASEATLCYSMTIDGDVVDAIAPVSALPSLHAARRVQKMRVVLSCTLLNEHAPRRLAVKLSGRWLEQPVKRLLAHFVRTKLASVGFDEEGQRLCVVRAGHQLDGDSILRDSVSDGDELLVILTPHVDGACAMPHPSGSDCQAHAPLSILIAVPSHGRRFGAGQSVLSSYR